MRKATSMKELNERRQQAEEMQKLRNENNIYQNANAQQAEALKEQRNELEARDQQIRSLQKDIDGMVRVHKEQVKTIEFYKEQVERHDKFAKDQSARIKQLEQSIADKAQQILVLQNDLNAARRDLADTRGAAVKPNATDEQLRTMHARITWYVERIEKLEERLAQLEAATKPSPQDDVVYKNAMQAMRLDVPPTITDVSFVQAATRKYRREIASSKEFSAWANKWSKEIILLLGV